MIHMMKPQEKGKNVIKTLEEFLESSKEKHEPTATPTLLFEPYEALNIDKLFRDVNCIKTNANKSLTKDGDWKYNGFNTYDIPEQQNTEASYVLNTKTHKFHKPSCNDVKKIKPENYGTSSSSRDELMSQGYSPCGHCNP